jgi:lysophospholipase L1-like esterase
VGNAGRSALFTIHHDYLLRHYAPASKFNWVIVLCGANDLGALLRDDYEGWANHVAEDTLRQSDTGLYYRRSAISKLVQLVVTGIPFLATRDENDVYQDASGLFLIQRRHERQLVLKRRTVTHAPPFLSRALHVYCKNLRKIIRTCRTRNQHLVLMTQPTLYDNEMPEHLRTLLVEHLIEYAYSEEALARMIDAFNRALLAVCRSDGVDCIDLASMLSRDTSTFYDDWHFNEAGCDKVAQIVSDFLVTRVATESTPSQHTMSASGRRSTAGTTAPQMTVSVKPRGASQRSLGIRGR